MSYAKFAQYDAYKDSGVEWLGDVPKNWTILRVKDTAIKIGNGVTPKGGSEVYTDVGIPFIRSQNVYDDGLHIGDVSFISDGIHRDIKGSQLKEGDILINITGASIGRTCVVPIELGIANINQHVAFLRTKYWFNTTYISLFLKSPFIKKYIQFEQNGASKEAFNLTQIANIPIVLPKVEEQTAIATYLDTKTAQIDRKIDLLTQKATQYGNLKQSLINETVTRGLDKTTTMKDSGVEWIGEMPEHWDVRHFKQFSTMKGRIGWQGLKHSEFIDEGPFLITGMNFKGGRINWNDVYHISEERYKQAPEIQLKDHDVLMTKDGTIGKLLYVENIPAPSKASLNSHLLVLRPIKKSFHPKYMYYQLDSATFKHYTEIVKAGTTFFGISQAAVGRYIATLPPLFEQKAIATYLDTKTTHIDRIIETINTQIEKLKELRKTLINDVVTGKIKVSQ
ncbi:MAG: restriction endonuclease subunit S [Deltaproteobacteria bacterium]|nr:restriction endonuclease subunit S [Deltaproteobacteria bacterium]